MHEGRAITPFHTCAHHAEMYPHLYAVEKPVRSTVTDENPPQLVAGQRCAVQNS